MEIKFQTTVDFTDEKLDYIGTNVDYCCEEAFATVYTSEKRMKKQIRKLAETADVEFIEERLFSHGMSEWKVRIPWINIAINV